MQTELEKAKISAFRLLKFRIRSKKEMENRLKQKNFSSLIIREVLDFLSDLGYLDDLAFARSWIINRRQLKPRSKRLITYELRQKGIDSDIIEQAFGLLGNDSDFETAQELAKRKYEKLKQLSAQTAKQRLIGFLERKGFSSAIIINIVKGLINNDEQ
ncbi:MAG: recombination regulator RecX [Candidatus Omnitrophica bacterium]|nr:recombination regulator RecX [Candidatus Omnitrophota bacterium]